MVHLRSISLLPGAKRQPGFPFTIPLVRKFAPIRFAGPVTFLAGENGSGKSTLLEALAAGIGLPTVGGEDVDHDPSLAAARRLAAQLRWAWTKKTRRGFFLRAEDFFNFTRRLRGMGRELTELADSYEGRLSGYGLALAKGSVLAQRQALVEKYGEDLDANSHGESFLKLFQARFVPGGLYLMDEPEAPLSPQRQLTLLALLKDMVAANAQFIIATHSPILMAFPGATILSFDQHPLRAVAYEELEHVRITREFLAHPAAYLRRL